MNRNSLWIEKLIPMATIVLSVTGCIDTPQAPASPTALPTSIPSPTTHITQTPTPNSTPEPSDVPEENVSAIDEQPQDDIRILQTQLQTFQMAFTTLQLSDDETEGTEIATPILQFADKEDLSRHTNPFFEQETFPEFESEEEILRTAILYSLAARTGVDDFLTLTPDQLRASLAGAIHNHQLNFDPSQDVNITYLLFTDSQADDPRLSSFTFTTASRNHIHWIGHRIERTEAGTLNIAVAVNQNLYPQSDEPQPGVKLGSAFCAGLYMALIELSQTEEETRDRLEDLLEYLFWEIDPDTGRYAIIWGNPILLQINSN